MSDKATQVSSAGEGEEDEDDASSNAKTKHDDDILERKTASST